jgi:ClpP class serine protease
MSTWTRVLNECQQRITQDQQNPPHPGQAGQLDQYRREKIAAVEKVTQRPLIIYATACTTSGKPVPSEMLMLDVSDKIGFKTVTDSIEGPNLDILIHSPGGYPDATESIVQQLRGKYSNIRFIVPSYAKSAATMLAMSGNEMDRDAELGPIDPQMRTQNGTSPAESILEQFKKAQAELLGNPAMLPS